MCVHPNHCILLSQDVRCTAAHVMCEKPMAINYGRQNADAAREIGHLRSPTRNRYRPDSQFLESE